MEGIAPVRKMDPPGPKVQVERPLLMKFPVVKSNTHPEQISIAPGFKGVPELTSMSTDIPLPTSGLAVVPAKEMVPEVGGAMVKSRTGAACAASGESNKPSPLIKAINTVERHFFAFFMFIITRPLCFV